MDQEDTHAGASHGSEEEQQGAGAPTGRDWALAVGWLHFVDGLSGRAVQDRLGIREHYYVQCMRWLLARSEASRSEGCDAHRVELATYAAGIAEAGQVIAIEDHISDCTGCLTFLCELLDATTQFVVGEGPHSLDAVLAVVSPQRNADVSPESGSCDEERAESEDRGAGRGRPPAMSVLAAYLLRRYSVPAEQQARLAAEREAVERDAAERDAVRPRSPKPNGSRSRRPLVLGARAVALALAGLLTIEGVTAFTDGAGGADRTAATVAEDADVDAPKSRDLLDSKASGAGEDPPSAPDDNDSGGDPPTQRASVEPDAVDGVPGPAPASTTAAPIFAASPEWSPVVNAANVPDVELVASQDVRPSVATERVGSDTTRSSDPLRFTAATSEPDARGAATPVPDIAEMTRAVEANLAAAHSQIESSLAEALKSVPAETTESTMSPKGVSAEDAVDLSAAPTPPDAGHDALVEPDSSASNSVATEPEADVEPAPVTEPEADVEPAPATQPQVSPATTADSPELVSPDLMDAPVLPPSHADEGMND